MTWYKLFEEVKLESSSNEKLRLLSEGLEPIHVEILRNTYNDEKYGINKKTLMKALGIETLGNYEDVGHWVDINYVGYYPKELNIDMKWLKTFNSTCIEKSGKDLFNYIVSVFNHLYPETVVWISRMLLKNLRIGMNVTSINKALISKGYEPIEVFVTQLCKPLDLNEPKEVSKVIFPCYGETKYDGTRTIAKIEYQIVDYGLLGSKKCYSVQLFSRSGINTTHQFPEILKALGEFSEINNLESITLDGEVISKDFNALQQRLGRKASNITEFDETLQFKVFDTLEFKRESMKEVIFEERLALLYSLNWTDKVNTSEGVECNNIRDIENFYKINIDRGEEGIIVKNYNGTYAKEKRDERKGQWKLKPNFTIDLRITDYEYGNGRNSPYISVLHLENKDKTIKTNTGSGLTDEWKKILTERKDEIVGKIVEIKYWELQPKDENGVQSLRFPIFVTLREDKTEED